MFWDFAEVILNQEISMIFRGAKFSKITADFSLQHRFSPLSFTCIIDMHLSEKAISYVSSMKILEKKRENPAFSKNVYVYKYI